MNTGDNRSDVTGAPELAPAREGGLVKRLARDVGPRHRAGEILFTAEPCAGAPDIDALDADARRDWILYLEDGREIVRDLSPGRTPGCVDLGFRHCGPDGELRFCVSLAVGEESNIPAASVIWSAPIVRRSVAI